MKRISYWLPPVIWMGVIFLLSTDEFSAQNTGSWFETVLRFLNLSFSEGTLRVLHFVLRKAAHLTGYAILALLFYRAVHSGKLPRWNVKTALIAFGLAAAYAIVDEVHQSFTLSRTGSPMDVIVDWAGAAGGLAVVRLILIARDAGISQARLRSADR